MIRLALAISFALLCVLDNIFTYEIIKYPFFREIAPVGMLINTFWALDSKVLCMFGIVLV